MNETPAQTIEDLKKKRLESLMLSEKAVVANPEAYREIKTLVNTVVFKTVDVGNYFTTTSRLAKLLEKMTRVGSGTIFNYFFENIDPKQYGEARYFRAMCLDLLEQINELDKWRADKRRLIVLKAQS